MRRLLNHSARRDAKTTVLRRMAALVLLCAASLSLVSCTQTGPTRKEGWAFAAPKAGETATAQETSPERSASGQKDAGWSQVRGRYWCGPPVTENESFFDKVTRLLFSRDWCGPDPDVDTNISAGGAAGG